MTKSDFTRLLFPVPFETVVNRINTIIYDNRKSYPENENKTKREIIKVRNIELVEMIEYFETYGWPKGIVQQQNPVKQ